MFGDILSDAASVLPGSLGLMPLKRSRAMHSNAGKHARRCRDELYRTLSIAPKGPKAYDQYSALPLKAVGCQIPRPSASLGDGLRMYEPSGGSAPDIAGSEMNLFLHCGNRSVNGSGRQRGGEPNRADLERRYDAEASFISLHPFEFRGEVIQSQVHVSTEVLPQSDSTS